MGFALVKTCVGANVCGCWLFWSSGAAIDLASARLGSAVVPAVRTSAVVHLASPADTVAQSYSAQHIGHRIDCACNLCNRQPSTDMSGTIPAQNTLAVKQSPSDTLRTWQQINDMWTFDAKWQLPAVVF